MKLHFYKYEGTGNDFIMIDNRLQIFPNTAVDLVKKLCDRRFGIGADGLILLENDQKTDFKMIYFNSDGNESSMCGNGGRCLVAFAKKMGIIDNQATFMAIDGLHNASISENELIQLQMKDVTKINLGNDYVFLDTGSPHHVTIVEAISEINVKETGAAIRYSDLYGSEGSNVNFVQKISDTHFAIRTYERGVEDETLSCGTGATATAIAMNFLNKSTSEIIQIDVVGGQLEVNFKVKDDSYTNVFLKGPATFVFEGNIEI